MKYKDNIAEKFPDFSNILIHIEDNDKRNKVVNPDADEFHLSKYMKDGRWIRAPFIRKNGNKEEFIRDITRLMNSYDPEALEIIIYEGKTDNKRISKKIVFEEPKQPDEGTAGNGSKSKDDKEYFGDNELKLKLIGKDNEINLLKLQHESDLRELNRDYENQILALKETIKEQSDELDDYEAETKEHETALGNVQNQYQELQKKKESHWLEPVVAGGVKTGISALFINYPQLLDGIGLDEDQKKILIKKIRENLNGTAKELPPGNQPAGSDASFTASGEDEFKGLTPSHAEMLKTLIPFLKQLPENELNVLGQVISHVVTKENKIDVPKINNILFIINEIDKEAKAKENSKPPVEKTEPVTA